MAADLRGILTCHGREDWEGALLSAYSRGGRPSLQLTPSPPRPPTACSHTPPATPATRRIRFLVRLRGPSTSSSHKDQRRGRPLREKEREEIQMPGTIIFPAPYILYLPRLINPQPGAATRSPARVAETANAAVSSGEHRNSPSSSLPHRL